MNLTALLDDIISVPKPVRSMVAHALGLTEAQHLYRSLIATADTRKFPQRLLDRLAVTCRFAEADLQQIPRTGPVIFVANHPFGILEGAVLASILTRVRPDIRFLANHLLSAVPEIRDLLIPVDAISGASAARRNAHSVRQSLAYLQTGGCVVVFPAGEVSHFHLRDRTVTDSPWHTAVARMIETLARKGETVSTVPIYISGSNSLLFQALGLIHPRLRTMLLARELLNKRNRLVELRIGSAVPSKKLLEIPTPEERTAYLRWRTYVLANRSDYKTNTALPFTRRSHRRTPQAVAGAADPSLLREEIAALGPDNLLTQASDLNVYLAPASQIPSTLREIGRLRELTFRAAGEGTGKSLDLDSFDDHYLHLFAWNPAKNEIVGAYRLAATDQVRELYTATLFQYGDAFLRKMGPAIELGRSFIRAEYQRSFAPLLALWKGIGTYLARNPRYRVLFGPVSISNQYQAVSRELMVTFLERHASLRDWMDLISNRNPFRMRSGKQPLPGAGFDLEELSSVVSDLEPSRAGIPVLLRQYLKLGGKLLGFNVDPEFSDALDGLILVDLNQTEPRLLERYLGKSQAAQFLERTI